MQLNKDPYAFNLYSSLRPWESHLGLLAPHNELSESLDQNIVERSTQKGLQPATASEKGCLTVNPPCN